MQTAQPTTDIPSIQAALHRLALSVDSLLVNGLQYGVLQPAAGEGFLQAAVDGLMTDLASLEAQVGKPSTVQTLRTSVEGLTDTVRGLVPFRTQPLPQVRATVERVRHLRDGCMQHIQQLETQMGVPKPFHQARPAHSASAVEAFLAQLDDAFVREWSAANER